MINVLLPIMLAVTNPQVDTVYNTSSTKEIDGRDVCFGVKETVEELVLDAGIDGSVEVEIFKIESPQQIINILGVKWLRKDYIVETRIYVDGTAKEGYGKRRTLVFAALLDVEGNEVPLNRKAFSKALQSSLTDSVEKHSR